MKKIKLGRSDLEVTQLCLGTMTWGTQNTEAEGHAQIDYAAEQGITFMDTAEMYPVNPVSKATVGGTEEIIGTWIAKNPGRRSDWTIATKISGLNENFVREGQPVTGASMKEAVEGSLRRLQTDVIDLYQIHWPNRGSYHFRQHWGYDASRQNRQETLDNMADVLRAMDDLQKAGKVREFGLSNETAWGTAQWLRLADELGAPRMQTIQNEYSLLCRMFDLDLAELCVNEDVTLLAYSPLGCGLLTGKYNGGKTIPEGSRLALNGDLGGRVTPKIWPAVQAYLEVAEKHGLNAAQMAIAWCNIRPFPISPIFGATTMEQLKIAIGAEALELSEEVITELDAVNRQYPLPM